MYMFKRKKNMKEQLVNEENVEALNAKWNDEVEACKVKMKNNVINNSYYRPEDKLVSVGNEVYTSTGNLVCSVSSKDYKVGIDPNRLGSVQSTITGNTLYNQGLINPNPGSYTWTTPLSYNNSGYNQIHLPSPFEVILDDLFSFEDKVEYLKSIGYEFEDKSLEIHSKFWRERNSQDDEEEKTEYIIHVHLNEIFLREISIKFKNLLLAKPNLKLKL